MNLNVCILRYLSTKLFSIDLLISKNIFFVSKKTDVKMDIDNKKFKERKVDKISEQQRVILVYHKKILSQHMHVCVGRKFNST